MPAVPTAKHKAKGWLSAVIRRSLEVGPAPVSAHRLALELRASDPSIHESSVFRALGKLEQARVVRRVETSKSYVIRQPDDVIDLLCERCGQHREHSAPGLFARAEQIANSIGFTANRLIAEMVGTCGHCVAKSPGDTS